MNTQWQQSFDYNKLAFVVAQKRQPKTNNGTL